MHAGVRACVCLRQRDLFAILSFRSRMAVRSAAVRLSQQRNVVSKASHVKWLGKKADILKQELERK